MAEKVIDLRKTVYELSKEYPELPQILEEIGFRDITKPGMLASAGRFMSIPKGATLKKIDLNDIIQKFEQMGYTVIRG